MKAIVWQPYQTFTNWWIDTSVVYSNPNILGRCVLDNGLPPGSVGYNGISSYFTKSRTCFYNTQQGQTVLGSAYSFWAGSGYDTFCRLPTRPEPEKDSKNANPTCGHGNPIDCSTGNKFQIETDYSATGPQPLRLTRVYHSQFDIRDASLGSRWRHTYARSIERLPDRDIVWRETGQMLVFMASGATLVPDADISHRLERTFDGGNVFTGWRLTRSDTEEVERYDAAGRLTSISDRAGLVLTMVYSTASTPLTIAPRPGLLIGVNDGRGRSLGFAYSHTAQLIRLTDPAGGLTQYTYSASNQLTRVTYPDGTFRTYHYGESQHTGGVLRPDALPASPTSAVSGWKTQNKIQCETMTPKQADDFVRQVKQSSDPRIRDFNNRIYQRIINGAFRRIPGGRAGNE